MPKLSLIRIASVTNVLDGKMSFEILPIGKMLPNQFPQDVRAKQGSQIVLFFFSLEPFSSLSLQKRFMAEKESI